MLVVTGAVSGPWLVEVMMLFVFVFAHLA